MAVQSKGAQELMPVQLHAVKPAALAVTIFTVPVQLNKVALQSLLPTLSRFDLESYSPTSEGGALLANQSLQKNLTVSPTSRQVAVARSDRFFVACSTLRCWPRRVYLARSRVR